MAERIWYVKQCHLFEKVPTDQLARLEANARIQHLPKNSSIYVPTDASESVFVLLSGRVRLCNYTPDGKQAILAFIEPGELFGEFALLNADGYDEYAETMLPSSVALIPKIDIDRLLTENASFSLGITKVISWRRRRIERRLRSLLFRSNRDRLIQLLLDLAEQYGCPQAGGLLIDIRLSHQEMASIIGCTRESVTLLLGELQTQGRLKINRHRIVLMDRDALVAEMHAAEFRTRNSNGRKGRIGPSLVESRVKKSADSCGS